MSSHYPEPGVPAGTEHGQLSPLSNSPHHPQPQPSPPSITPVDAQNTAQSGNAAAQHDDQVTDTKNTSSTTGGENTMPAASAPSEGTEAANESQIEPSDQKIIAPAVEKVDSAEAKEMDDSGPSLVITLLLTTGARHPFKIDGKYLRKRSVNVDNHDPFSMSVYTLKELIWREWRSDWETRPASPSSIRLISFGKLLEDKSPLSDSKFNCDAPNVVHMTVKPQEMIDEEDAKGTKAQYSRERETNERSPGCRCVIQ